MKSFYLLVLCALMASCMTEKKANSYYNSHPDKLASLCAAHFNNTDSVKDSTVFVPGKTVYVHDSVTVDVTAMVDSATKSKTAAQTKVLRDSILNHPLYIKIPCPDLPVQTPDTEKEFHYVQVSNNAKEVALADANTKLISANAVLTAKLKAKDKAILIMAAIIGVSIMVVIIKVWLKHFAKVPI